MRPWAPILRRLRALGAAEEGVAVPTVLLLIVAAFSLASVSVLSTIATQRSGSRDQDSKSALATADAAANLAFWRQNKMPPATGQFCSGNATPSGGWCPAYTGTVGTSSYSYRVSVPDVNGDVKIVATGTRDGVNRKVELITEEISAADAFGDYGVLTDDWLDMDSNARIEVPVGSNGDITMNANAVICGDIRYGEGETLNMIGNAEQCPGYEVTQGDQALPPVFKPGLATSNDNGRFFSLDLRSGDTSQVTWNSSTRVLSLNGSGVLTMGGNNYFLCRLVMDSNARLIMAAGAQVRVYFDTPENCNLSSGTAQLSMESNTEISSTGYNPGVGTYDLISFFFFGSPTRASSINLNSNALVSNEMVIYAPYHDVEMNSNSVYIGAIASKTLHMDSNAVITVDPNAPLPLVDIATYYTVSRYVECGTQVGGTAPDSGC